jgi:hypothetical protein
MQPYFFPYLGYFQLAAASSVFVFLDDVTFIKGGWINRNRFLVQGQAHTFSVPLRGASSHRLIGDVTIAEDTDWRTRFLRLLEQSYARAPFRTDTLALVRSVLSSTHASIGSLAAASVKAVCAHVGVQPAWLSSREAHPAAGRKGSGRVLELCRALDANRYVNAPGGKALYSAAEFSAQGIELRFLSPPSIRYNQFGQDFVAGLSIIDVMMFNSVTQVRALMEAYSLE